MMHWRECIIISKLLSISKANKKMFLIAELGWEANRCYDEALVPDKEDWFTPLLLCRKEGSDSVSLIFQWYAP